MVIIYGKSAIPQAIDCTIDETAILTEENNNPMSSSTLGTMGSLSIACFDIQWISEQKFNISSGSQPYFKKGKEKSWQNYLLKRATETFENRYIELLAV